MERKARDPRIGMHDEGDKFCINTGCLCGGNPQPMHSPTPWEVYGTWNVMAANQRHIASFGYVGTHETEAESRENMELIVRAVNNHEALIAALKDQHRVAVEHFRGGWAAYHKTPCKFCRVIEEAEARS